MKHKFQRMLTKKKKELFKSLNSKNLSMQKIKDGEFRVLTTPSDQDDSDIDIDPNKEIQDKFGLFEPTLPPNIINY